MTLVFSPARFNALLSNALPGLGQNILWARATQCPCRNRHSGAAEQGCPVCFGKGYFYGPNIAAWTGLSGQKVMRAWAAFGEFEIGDVVCTIPSDSPFYDVGENDRVIFTDSTEPFSQIIMGGVDLLPFEASSIDGVVWRDPTTREIVTGGIPTQGVDNTLTWASGGPPALVQYTITGRKHPAYWDFIDFPQDRAHSAGLRLPRRVVLRKYSLASH